MGRPGNFQQVKLFCGIIYRDNGDCDRVAGELEKRFSRIDSRSDVFEFDVTSYYEKEMGKPLFRRFFSFRRLICPTRLPRVKLKTNQLEEIFSRSGCRTVNLDPGFLSTGNVIIATTKNYYHRVPLQQGIYAHLEFVIKKKEIFPLEWTYPDFRSRGYRAYFTGLRQLYQEQLNA